MQNALGPPESFFYVFFSSKQGGVLAGFPLGAGSLPWAIFPMWLWQPGWCAWNSPCFSEQMCPEQLSGHGQDYHPQQGFEPKFLAPAIAKKAQLYLQCCFLTKQVYIFLMLYTGIMILFYCQQIELFTE